MTILIHMRRAKELADVSDLKFVTDYGSVELA